MSNATIDPTAEQIRRLAASPEDGPIVMLNLLRFKDRVQPANGGEEISGMDAYQRYGAAVASSLAKVGGSLLFAAECKQNVIGPEDERWDLVALARYPSRAAFLQMVGELEFSEKHELRSASLQDSRLICCEQITG